MLTKNPIQRLRSIGVCQKPHCFAHKLTLSHTITHVNVLHSLIDLLKLGHICNKPADSHVPSYIMLLIEDNEAHIGLNRLNVRAEDTCFVKWGSMRVSFVLSENGLLCSVVPLGCVSEQHVPTRTHPATIPPSRPWHHRGERLNCWYELNTTFVCFMTKINRISNHMNGTIS